MTQVGLGRLVRYSNAYISNVETAKEPPSLRFVQQADDHLHTGGSLELLWWSWKNGALIPGFPEFAAEEAKARAMRLFELDVVPGLLQTAEYASAYESAPVRRGDATQQQADKRVSFLLARQERTGRSPAPLIHAVLDEWCIRRPIGGAATMVGQLRHLENLADRPTVIIQVSPISLGEARPFPHAITLLTMPNRSMLGYTETMKRGYLERDADTVATWARNYDQLQVEALSRAASVDLIRAVRKDFENHAR